MADIINFPSDPVPQPFESASEDDLFLRDEGLELLAYFRAIRDPAVRGSISTLIRSLAESKPSASLS